MSALCNRIPYENVTVQTRIGRSVFGNGSCHPIIIISSSHLVRITIRKGIVNTDNKDGGIVLKNFSFSLFPWKIWIPVKDFFCMDKV